MIVVDPGFGCVCLLFPDYRVIWGLYPNGQGGFSWVPGRGSAGFHFRGVSQSGFRPDGELFFFAPPKTNSPGANLHSRRLARRAKSRDGLRISTQKTGGPEGLIVRTLELARPLRNLVLCFPLFRALVAQPQGQQGRASMQSRQPQLYLSNRLPDSSERQVPANR